MLYMISDNDQRKNEIMNKYIVSAEKIEAIYEQNLIPYYQDLLREIFVAYETNSTLPPDVETDIQYELRKE